MLEDWVLEILEEILNFVRIVHPPQSKLQELLPRDLDLDFILRDPLLFGDFKNALNEGEVRHYEDLQDFEAVEALLQEVSSPLPILPFKPAFLLFQQNPHPPSDTPFHLFQTSSILSS